ncbi:MAG: IS4 family transposase [Desulfosarcina sp.]|nr:IS4 family transposase [Desulfobacterales bacterium]
MNGINTLPKTTFSGRRFTRKQLEEVQETVQRFQNLSRKELALTLCEHLDWTTPNGKLKVNSALTLLEKLEFYGVVTLPAKKKVKAQVRRIPAFVEHPETHPINDTLNVIAPISLQRIRSKEDREDWKAYIQTYHYLGYKHPVGGHIGYFIVSEARRQKLGCLLFSASAALTLAPRDKLIGWEKKHRQKLLHLIISNNRFLIFPWINVPNLASHALSLATKQIGDDWLDTYGYRPVLIETFVDTTKYSGCCYQAANWQYIGKTKGRGRFDPKHECKQTIKDIYIYPINFDWRHTLTTCRSSSSLKKKYRNDIQSSNTRSVDDDFVSLWEKVVKVISEIASQYDEQWQVRKRVINSMLIILLIFRLVCSKNSQSYGTTIDELWDSCDRLDLPLPQKGSIAPSSFCAARKKLDEAVFKQINRKIISTYAQQYQEDNTYKWLGHRIFAVDGSKINLPRTLLSSNYKLPSKNANYPQGLLSCLYQIKSQMPFDFDLVSHANERICAQQHLDTLQENDIVVYDRGYFSYAMLHQHFDSKIHAVFRLQKNSYTVIKDFFSSPDTDIIVTIYPSSNKRREIMVKYPDLEIIPIQMRLIKYHIGDNTYCLGTTLVDQKQYSNIQDFIDIYHARWGVEELYKVSKRIFIIEDFHAKSERGVKQEIFAHFVLITMNRIFANKADADLNQSNNSVIHTTEDKNFSLKAQIHTIKTNFKNCIHVFSRSLEELLLLQTKMSTAVKRAYHFIIGRNQKERPGRSYVRKSMKPESKWRPPKEKKKKKKISVPPPMTVPM